MGGPIDPIVLGLEGDAVLVGGQQPAIGDRDAVGVAPATPGPYARLIFLLQLPFVCSNERADVVRHVQQL